MFIDLPGSGKTTFAKNLAARIQGVVLSSDSMRLAMWKTLEAIAEAKMNPEERKRSNQIVFGAMDYATQQVLTAGHSVIYDANASHVAERQEKYAIAEECGAVPVIVRIKVPYEVSLHRLQTRPATHDARQLTYERAKDILQNFADNLEEPTEDERVIEISGEVPFEEQYAVFQQKIAEITNE